MQLAPPKNDVSLFELLFEVGFFFSYSSFGEFGLFETLICQCRDKIHAKKNFPWSKTVTEFVNIRIWLFGVKISVQPCTLCLKMLTPFLCPEPSLSSSVGADDTGPCQLFYGWLQ